jgi:hypothetical protein
MDIELRAYLMDDFKTRIYAAGAPNPINPNVFREYIRIFAMIQGNINDEDNDDELPELI